MFTIMRSALNNLLTEMLKESASVPIGGYGRYWMHSGRSGGPSIGRFVSGLRAASGNDDASRGRGCQQRSSPEEKAASSANKVLFVFPFLVRQ